MTHRHPTRLAGFAILALGLALSGCSVDDGSLVIEASDTDDVEYALPEQDREDDAGDVVVLPPEHVEVYVGEELFLDVLNEDPEAYVLRPTQLPEGSDYEPVEDGGILHWVPEAEDIGTHEVIFLHADIDNPSLFLFSRTIVLDVLPRFDLIEYGF